MIQTALVDTTISTAPRIRHSVSNSDPMVLTEIYKEEHNIAIWQRKLSERVNKAAQIVLQNQPMLQISAVTTPDTIKEIIYKELNEETSQTQVLVEDIAQVMDMFCCIFELKNVGLRLSSLDTAMCPRFHVDKVPCRLITTYSGIATEWLQHDNVDRTKLGHGNQGKPDEESGIYQDANDINHLQTGDVALLKGEMWVGNEGAGLVHRSPQLATNSRRLLLTLDFEKD